MSEQEKIAACDYCICWFCNLRKDCPHSENHCKSEETPQCDNQTVAKDFSCTEADFGEP